MAIIVGSIFYDLDETTNSFYSRGVLLFFAVLLNAFMSSFEASQLHLSSISELTDGVAGRSSPCGLNGPS